MHLCRAELSRLQFVSLRHLILFTASLVLRSELNNVIYHNSGYHLLANRASIAHPRLVLSDGLPFTKSSCLRTSDNRLHDTSILRSAQMFVRYETEAPFRVRETTKTFKFKYYIMYMYDKIPW